MAATTRRMPAAMMRRVQGPVRPRMATRLEIDEQRRAARAIARVVQRKHLGVRRTRAGMPALADHHAVRRDHDRADERIRRGDTFGAAGVKQRTPHEVRVGHHLSWKMASTYSLGLNGSRSSTPSPTPT